MAETSMTNSRISSTFWENYNRKAAYGIIAKTHFGYIGKPELAEEWLRKHTNLNFCKPGDTIEWVG